ncbi:MAG: valine--tRNA ligase [Verrucomicrobia bacterium]|nr:valine--tRNA ligase [Verrucomicrobiota bacterium]
MNEWPKQYTANEVEGKWMSRWKEMGIHRWDPVRGRDETFVMDSPPPTVSGALHIGHVFSYTHQDLIVRQKRMSGLNIFYPMGWDDNGLPTERRVQNYFNVRCDPYLPHDPHYTPKTDGKGPPEKVSRPNFIQLCRQVTRSDEEAFRRLWQRLGLSIDWDQEYATIDDFSRKTSQLSFLQLLRDGHVYLTETPTLWDVDFQTAVAQAEVEDRMMAGAFHNLRFGVKEGGSFVIATTRPELLAACVAVVAHPDDARYRPLFGKQAVTPLFRAPVPILPDGRADPEKGTGILMVCTFGDATDVEWWRQFNLPLRQILGKDGRLLPVKFGAAGWDSLDAPAANRFYSELEGRNVKQARTAIVAMLRTPDGAALPDLGAPLTGEPRPIQHSVKQFEKGERPLEIITARQWFVRLLDKKEALIQQGAKIQWHPPYMRARYESWVEGLNQDWCVSRQRYFGVPFPVWHPLDDEGRPHYDRPILPKPEQLPVDPLAEPAPGFDESLRGKPRGFIGDPDVMDTWATSSLTPQIASRWAEDAARHRKLFPMDVRPQSHEIIRTWAFYTIAKAFLHERQVPWRHVVISGWILDPDRKKMSKSKGNVVIPDHLLEQYSSDAVRYWAARARLGVDTAYDEAVFKNGNRLATKIFNASKFVAGHFEGQDLAALTPAMVTEALDQGLVGRLREVVRKAGEEFAAFEYANALQSAEEFFWSDFCDNYLELVKGRCYEKEETAGKRSALATLKLLLSVQLRLFAPYLPFLTEEMWSRLFAAREGRERSIHTAPWPTEAELRAVAEPSASDPYGAAADALREIRKVKGEAKVSMKTPLKELEITGNAKDLDAVRSVMQDLLSVSGAPAARLTEGKVENGRFKIRAAL